MSPRAFRVTALAVAAGGLLVLVVWIVGNLPWSEEVRDVGFRGEARRNPLLACERTLSAMGVPATSRSGIGALPTPDDVLVLRNTGRYLAPATIGRVLDWVESGGNLILLFPATDEVLEQLEDAIEAGRFELPFARELDVHCILDDPPEIVAEVDLGQGPLQIQLPGRFAFEDSMGRADYAAGEAMRSRLLSFERGLGRVTLVADDQWAGNAGIGEHDHARVLWQLVTLDGPRAGALIVYSERPPGLLLLLAKNAWMVLASLAVFVALQLWRIGARFGPLLPDPSRDRRDFSEHIVAAGEFLWRNRASGQLLEAPRRDLHRRIGLRRPDLSAAAPVQLAEALAGASGLDVARVRRALELRQASDASQFTGVVRDLETLRKAL